MSGLLNCWRGWALNRSDYVSGKKKPLVKTRGFFIAGDKVRLTEFAWVKTTEDWLIKPRRDMLDGVVVECVYDGYKIDWGVFTSLMGAVWIYDYLELVS